MLAEDRDAPGRDAPGLDARDGARDDAAETSTAAINPPNVRIAAEKRTAAINARKVESMSRKRNARRQQHAVLVLAGARTRKVPDHAQSAEAKAALVKALLQRMKAVQQKIDKTTTEIKTFKEELTKIFTEMMALVN